MRRAFVISALAFWTTLVLVVGSRTGGRDLSAPGLLPVLIGVLAGVGIGWLVGRRMRRSHE